MISLIDVVVICKTKTTLLDFPQHTWRQLRSDHVMTGRMRKRSVASSSRA